MAITTLEITAPGTGDLGNFCGDFVMQRPDREVRDFFRAMKTYAQAEGLYSWDPDNQRLTKLANGEVARTHREGHYQMTIFPPIDWNDLRETMATGRLPVELVVGEEREYGILNISQIKKGKIFTEYLGLIEIPETE